MIRDRIALYQPSQRAAPDANPFGKDVANLGLFRAIVRHGGFDRVDFLMNGPVAPAALAAALGVADDAPIGTGSILDQRLAGAAGTLLRGTPLLEPLAWERRKAVGDSAYSLIGLIHTIAPPSIRQEIADASIAPIHAWDALVCTSPSVRDAVVRLFDEWEDYLAGRFGGRRPARPQLPVIPLGVDGAALAAVADRPDVRAATRASLGMGEADVLILWVGRLSFFEKAFPQPMMQATEEAARQTGARVHFAMVGWFPSPATQEPMYRAAAAAYAPSVALHIVDGNDPVRRDAMWAAADIFLSLVDNIQETFGLTPIEAMACGLPVVVSDWDGYRSTVRHGEDGFLIPTLIGPAGALPDALASGHAIGIQSYQNYVGAIAQHTAVHIGRAADALAALIRDPALRRRMGKAGRARVRDLFDWSAVALQYRALSRELAAIRGRGDPIAPAPHPAKGDPLRDFAGFASAALEVDGRLWLRTPVDEATMARMERLELDRFAAGVRGSIDEARGVAAILADAPGTTVRELLTHFAVDRRRRVRLSLLWMAKLGLIEWLAPESAAADDHASTGDDE